MADEQPSASSTHHAKVADVVSLVVQHCHDFNKMQDICRLLLVSSTIRQQLLRARGHGSMDFATGSAADDAVQLTSKLAGFMQWLPRHASLVDSICLENYDDAAHVMQLALQMCTLALRHCRITTAAAAAGVAAAAHDLAAVGEPALQPLRLCSAIVESGASREDVLQLVPRALLQELAAAQTQKLFLTGGTFGAAAVLQLGTSLQELECAYMECSAVQLLPPSLQVLNSNFVRGSSNSGSGGSSNIGCLDLQHLTQLRELVCKRSNDGCTLKVKLPAQLTRLIAHTRLHEVTGGTGLLNVDLLWHGLGKLRSLRDVIGPWRLSLVVLKCPEGAAPPVAAAAAAAAATLSTATSLTGLYAGTLSGGAFGGGQLCAAVSSLPRLRMLYLYNINVNCVDLLALTALTQLRALFLNNVAGCDDAVAAMLAHSLTGLTSLVLRSPSISSKGPGLLAVCGRLTNLCSLSVGGVPEFCVGDKELLLLSGLTQLTHLACAPQNCSPAGKERFLAGMPRLTRVEQLD